MVLFLQNMLVLGDHMLNNVYFPTYTTTRVIRLGDFLERIETFFTITVILAGFVEFGVCLMAAAKGMAKFFNVSNYKNILFPVMLLATGLSALLYRNVMEMFDFMDAYTWYALPFQILIPVVLWIVAEIRARFRKSGAAA